MGFALRRQVAGPQALGACGMGLFHERIMGRMESVYLEELIPAVIIISWQVAIVELCVVGLVMKRFRKQHPSLLADLEDSQALQIHGKP